MREKIAWTHPDGDDGWLAMDRNGNGRIDDGTELFGNHTPAFRNQSAPTAANGFVALAFLENPSYGPSNGNGVLETHDTPFAQLLVWVDADHNGESDPRELRPLREIGLVGIETEYKESQQVDANGNQFRQRAFSWWRGENGELTPRYLYDIWLKLEPRAR